MNEQTASIPEYDCNAHCRETECPGTGWEWNGLQCFNQFGKVRACPAPGDVTRYRNGVPVRAPLGEYVPQDPALPDPVPCELPAPKPPFDPANVADVARWCRKGFGGGRGLQRLASELARFKVPNGGAEWKHYHVKALLLAHPREKRQRVRRAA